MMMMMMIFSYNKNNTSPVQSWIRFFERTKQTVHTETIIEGNRKKIMEN